MKQAEIDAWLKERAEKDARLYEMYGKALEAKHKGEFVAISDDGEVLLSKDKQHLEVEAFEKFGSGHYGLKRIGYRAEGKWSRVG